MSFEGSDPQLLVGFIMDLTVARFVNVNCTHIEFYYIGGIVVGLRQHTSTVFVLLNAQCTEVMTGCAFIYLQKVVICLSDQRIKVY